MKKWLTGLCAVTTGFCLLSYTVNAETYPTTPTNWQVTFNGTALQSNFTTATIQESIQGMQPGDDANFEINLANNYSTPVDWYMENEVIASFEDTSVAKGGAYSYVLTYYPTTGAPQLLYTSNTVGGEGAAADGSVGLYQATNALDEYLYLERIPSGGKAKMLLHVELDGETRKTAISVPADATEVLSKNMMINKRFRPYTDASVNLLRIPKARLLTGGPQSEDVTLIIELCAEDNGGACISHTEQTVSVGVDETELSIPLRTAKLKADGLYSLSVAVKEGPDVQLRRVAIANENWDEGLPFRMRGLDPFGQLYTGITNEVRWYDNQDKRDMFMRVLPQADYLILPSQRGIWSVCRIPKTYPMTMAYYQALFDGTLGFKLVGEYQRPIKIGPFYISDLAGTVTTEVPKLPVVNLSNWAAEEAFSIYDHPPVWIFEKTEDFSEEKLRDFLNSFDLSKVVIQGPKDAEWE